VDASGELRVAPGRGMPNGLLIPAAELVERFSRSSGPGGQGVNTTDSRVELSFDVASSTALTELQRQRAMAGLASRLVGGTVTITASEHRSQLQNRAAARARLVHYLTEALAPPAPSRRATKPSRGARQRRLDVKKQRGQIKAGRAAVRHD
jgi:ribosome-associated protein